jgi:hypothetical protein
MMRAIKAACRTIMFLPAAPQTRRTRLARASLCQHPGRASDRLDK